MRSVKIEMLSKTYVQVEEQLGRKGLSSNALNLTNQSVNLQSLASFTAFAVSTLQSACLGLKPMTRSLILCQVEP